MKPHKFDPRLRILIEVIIIITIVLLYQFLFPQSFRPLVYYLGGHLDGGTLLQTNNAIFSLSIWVFSMSIVWIFDQDNIFLNNFLIFSPIFAGIIVVVEFIYLNLFFDYIHIFILVIGIIILLKKRGILKTKRMALSAAIMIGWLLLTYFLGLAYSEIPILLFILGLLIFGCVMAEITLLNAKYRSFRNGKYKILKTTLLIILVFFLGFGIFLEGVLTEWYIRPNTANVHPGLEIETWAVVSDSMHNSNTDMIYWNNSFYLIHDRRPFHLGSEDAKLVILRSNDSYSWHKVIQLNVEGNDIRDPKFCDINGTLFLYALLNKGIMGTPYQTVYTNTSDGQNWNNFTPINLSGWLMWRPKTNDNLTWYCPAYWHEHGESILLNSTNGIEWSIVSTINEGLANDETAIEFLENGNIISTARLEGTADTLFGTPSACTLIATSEPPYTHWNYTKSYVTRLDGPVLFSYNNRTFAVARYQPGTRTVFTNLGSIFSKKRTALYLVETDKLIYLTDLPSAGDTSYPGVVIKHDELYISYYTSDINYDYPWLLGMVAKSEVRLAKINLTSLINII
jgi:hypothetical protein